MTDEQLLIQKIKSADRDACREFVEQNKRTVYAISYRLTGNHNDADDLSQVVFIKFFNSVRQYRQEAGIQSWLYRIAVNSYIDKKRKKVQQIMFRFSTKTEEPYEEQISSQRIRPDKSVESTFIKEHVNKAVEKLSPKEKAAFILKYYEDHSIREIAEMIETSEGTVKSLLFRGIKKLQQALAFYKPELGLEDVK